MTFLRDTCFVPVASCARTGEPIWTGKNVLSWTDDSNAIWSILICFLSRGTCLWHVARDLTNLLFVDERLIRFEPERRHSTHVDDENVVVSMFGYSRNGTWHMLLACSKQLDEIASRNRTSSPIETGKQWRWNYFFTGGGGAHLTSDVTTDFRVWSGSMTSKPTYPQNFVSHRFNSHLM